MWNQALAIATVIVAASSALIYVIMAIGRKAPALRLTAAAFIMSAFAFILLTGQASVSPWITVVLANTLLTTAHLLLGSAYRYYAKRPRIWPFRFTVYLAAIFCALTAFQFALPSYTVRATVMSGLLVILGIEYISALLRKDSGLPRRVRLTVSAIPAVFSVFHLTRIVLVIRLNTNALRMMDVGTVTTYTFLGSIALFICWVGSVMILDTAQLLGEMEEKNRMLENLALRDKLTGLFNRHSLDGTILKEMERQDRYFTPLALVMLDIDHFKRINDLYGHDNGDAVLSEIAQRIKASIRETDMLFRWGGEEFLILCPNTDDAGAGLLAEKLRHVIQEREVSVTGTVTASFGVAERLEGETKDHWFHRVDQAMYRAKNSGRNRVAIWDESHREPFAKVAISWLREWNSGDPIIDREHRELIRIGNELINRVISKDSFDTTAHQLDDLIAHVKKHFAHEELILEKAGYREIDEHRAIHEQLIAEMENVRVIFERDHNDPTPLFNLLVNRIIIEHMLSSDALFFPCLAAYRKTTAGKEPSASRKPG